jgi:hypothetical protein
MRRAYDALLGDDDGTNRWPAHQQSKYILCNGINGTLFISIANLQLLEEGGLPECHPLPLREAWEREEDTSAGLHRCGPKLCYSDIHMSAPQ